MLVTAGYASLAAVFGLGLTVNIIRYRRKLKVSLGDGTHEQIVELLQRYTDKGPEILEKFEFSTPYGSKYFKLTQAVRAYGNFIETAPWAFLLIGLAEYNGLDAVYVHTPRPCSWHESHARLLTRGLQVRFWTRSCCIHV
ncbi:hypothetical protein BSLG_001729 [Batrachochytrium salamandrivorans]|nr:hypothetical protein BSLG_001729 [Batrachochytrium salamandrivorans]